MGRPSGCGYRAPDPVTATGRACAAVTVGWALIAAGGSAYRFLWSTQVIQNPGDGPALWGPAWLQAAGYLLALVGLAWDAVLIVLLVLGVFHLRGQIHAGPSWVIAWAAAVMAGMVLEVAYVFGHALTDSYPGYAGEHATSRPEYLWLAPGFLAVGAALLAIVRTAGRAALISGSA